MFKNYILVFVALVCTFASSLGWSMNDGNNEKQQEVFAKTKQIKLDATQNRISILQTFSNCLNSATNYEQAKACDETLNKAMEELQKNLNTRWEELKTQK